MILSYYFQALIFYSLSSGYSELLFLEYSMFRLTVFSAPNSHSLTSCTTHSFVDFKFLLRGTHFREIFPDLICSNISIDPFLHLLYFASQCMLSRFSHVQLFVTPWTIARWVPLFRGFSQQEYWNVLPCPPPGDLPEPGVKPKSPVSPALRVDSLPLSHRRIRRFHNT